jgi:hypothetical protein
VDRRRAGEFGSYGYVKQHFGLAAFERSRPAHVTENTIATAGPIQLKPEHQNCPRISTWTTAVESSRESICKETRYRFPFSRSGLSAEDLSRHAVDA